MWRCNWNQPGRYYLRHNHLERHGCKRSLMVRYLFRPSLSPLEWDGRHVHCRSVGPDMKYDGVDSLPLNRSGGFGRDVVHDAVDPPNFVDDSIRTAAEKFMRELGPIGRHPIEADHRPQSANI